MLHQVTTGESDKVMSEGKYESDKAIHTVLPSFRPKPYTWGQYEASEPARYFLLAECREIGQQPPEPMCLASRLAELHKKFVSQTGKFGFHTTACHGKAPQLTECWDDSWERLYHK
jgi:protein-ribulosamine 3-kinase